MKQLTKVSMLFLLATVLICQTCLAAPTTIDVSDESQTRLRRSLCNTFGGCGAKRSIQQLPNSYVANENNGFSVGDATRTDTSNNLAVDRKHSNANLIAEILGDLLEYLQSSEKYRQGKYVLVVPKQYDAPVNSMISTIGQQSGNNVADGLQEIQVSRLYLNNKND